MAIPGGVRQAVEALRENLEDITAEVEEVQAIASADKEELKEMMTELKDELMQEIAVLGQAIASITDMVKQHGGHKGRRELMNVKGSVPEIFYGKPDENFK